MKIKIWSPIKTPTVVYVKKDSLEKSVKLILMIVKESSVRTMGPVKMETTPSLVFVLKDSQETNVRQLFIVLEPTVGLVDLELIMIPVCVLVDSLALTVS